MMKRKAPDQVVAVATRLNRDGSVDVLGNVSDEDKASILATIAAERDAQMTYEARRRALWGKPGPEAMTRLANLFPTLQTADGVAPWNAMAFLEWLCGPAPSSGARWAGLFVLGVWNNTDWSAAARAELSARTCDTCGGVGQLAHETAGRVRRDGARYFRTTYDDDGRVLGEESVATDPCDRCEGSGKYVPSLAPGRFDVFSAIAVWDREHIAAFRMWVDFPFWP